LDIKKDAVDCVVRLYDLLFLKDDPNKAEGTWEEKINKDSLNEKLHAKMNKNLLGAKHLDRFQFERQGFFCVDYDSDLQKGHYVWNKTVGLVDNAKKKAMDRMKEK